MHSTIVSLTCVSLALVEVVGLSSSRQVQAVILAATVAFIGLPHGAFDHVTGQRLLRPFLGNLWAFAFFSLYLAIASCVVMGWYLWPVGTILAFFLVSAWHFGIEERVTSPRELFSQAQAIASGGLVIWVPALMRPSEVTELLKLISPGGDLETAAHCVWVTSAFTVMLAPLALFNGMESLRQLRSVQSLLSSEFVRILALTLMFTTVSPLISFTVYFCGWHSIRGLVRIAEAGRDDPVNIVLKLAPLSLIAIGLAIAGFTMWSSTQTLTPALLRTVFIGLSALAVPHLCLHVADSFMSPSRSGALYLKRESQDAAHYGIL